MININTELPNQYKDMKFEELTWYDLFYYYLTTFTGIAQIVFKWEGMPDTVNTEYLEKRLLYEGYCFYFQDPVMGDLALGGAYYDLDVYGWPARFTARGQNGSYVNSRLTKKDCVIIFDNIERSVTLQNLFTICNRLADLVTSMMGNIRKQKTPYIIAADEDSLLTIQNILRDINANLPDIITKKGFNKDDIQVWNLTAPLIVKDLREEFTALFNEGLTYVGIPNVQMQKRERLITDEVERSLGGAEANSCRRYLARVNAAEKINKMFGLNISVVNRFWTGSDSGAASDDTEEDLDIGLDPEGGEADE